jgi:CheY-like chemotaxis protein
MTHKIFVVEDDQPILDLMDLLIQKMGYQPILISNGVDALEAAKADPPSLILLDIMMSPINGWEFLEQLRASKGMETIPVILFTASPTVEEKMGQLNDKILACSRSRSRTPSLRQGSNVSCKSKFLFFTVNNSLEGRFFP